MGKKRGTVLVLSAVVVSIALCVIWAKGNEEETRVSTVPVTQQDIYYSIVVSGTVEAQSSVSYTAGEVSTVDAVYVKSGDTVHAGDALFTLRRSETAPEISAGTLEGIISTFAASGASGSRIAAVDETVYASMDATVISVPQSGQSVFPGIAFCQIADLTQLQVFASVPELYAGKVSIGQKANIEVAANPELLLSATVQSIAPVAVQSISLTGDQTSANVQAVLSLPSEEQWLRPGYSVTAKIFTDEQKNAMILPYAAVRQEETQEYVLVVEDGIVMRRDITSGYMLENAIEIREGLTGNEAVIVSADVSLTEGQSVEVAQ